MFSRFFDMVLLITRVYFILVFFFTLFLAGSVEARTITGTVIKIIDGDSFIMEDKGNSREIRLYGIDCPEYGQPFSRSAKKFVIHKALHRKVTVTPYYHDSYGRLVATVKTGRRILNRELVESGLARVYPKYCKKSFCKDWKRAEQEAQKAARGIWAHPDSSSPWEFRRKK